MLVPYGEHPGGEYGCVGCCPPGYEHPPHEGGAIPYRDPAAYPCEPPQFTGNMDQGSPHEGMRFEQSEPVDFSTCNSPGQPKHMDMNGYPLQEHPGIPHYPG